MPDVLKNPMLSDVLYVLGVNRINMLIHMAKLLLSIDIISRIDNFVRISSEVLMSFTYQ